MNRYTTLFFLIMFLIGTDTFLNSPLLPTLQAEFDVPTGSAGWMLGAYTLGSAVFALVAGPLSDGWNRRTVLLGGLLGFAVSTALCGFAWDFWSMCLFRLLAGISAAFTAPQVWASIPAVLRGPQIPKAMGLAYAGLAASQALGVPIGSGLAAARWSVPFWTIGGAALLLALFARAALPELKPLSGAAGRASILRRYAPLAASGRARSGFLAYFLLHLGAGSAFAFAGKWMADRFGLSVGEIGVAMIFLGFGNLLGSAVSSFFARKLGVPGAVAAGMALAAALYAVLPRLGWLPAATSLYFVIFAALGVVFPLVMGLLTGLNASLRGTISSLANATMNGANTLGAWLSGLLYVHLGGYPAIGLFAAAAIAVSLSFFRFGGLLLREANLPANENSTPPVS